MKAVVPSIMVLILFAPCQKPGAYYPKLPAATTSGLNTLGFIYNGSEIWESITEFGDMFGAIHYSEFAGCQLQNRLDGTTAFNFTGSMYLKSRNGKGSSIVDNSSITIDLEKAVFTDKIYTFDTLNISRVIFKNDLTGKVYYNLNNTFTLSVTYIDSTQKIISGLFSGKVYSYSLSGNNYSVSDSLQIQDGRFDIKYL